MQPTVRDLRSATADLAVVSPRLARSFGVLNRFFNMLAYDPPGARKSFNFWAAWGAHAGATLFTLQDAHGPIRRGLVLVNCNGYDVLEQVILGNPELGLLTRLLNLPPEQRDLPDQRATGRPHPMIKETPSFGRIFAMVAFTLSCFGILVFLWLNFGGSVRSSPRATA